MISQYFNEYTIKPLHEYKKLKAQLTCDLIFYNNIIHNPSNLEHEKYQETSKILRNDAAELTAFAIKKPFDFLPTSGKMKDVARSLIGLSNSLDIVNPTKEDFDSIRECEKIIKNFLKICNL